MKSERFVVEGVIPNLFSPSCGVELQVFDDGTLSGSVLETNEDSGPFMLLHGIAVKHKRFENTYDVRFQLVKARLQERVLHGYVRLSTIEGTLTPTSGLRAQCRNSAGTYEFHLPVRQPRDVIQKPPVQHLGALVPGKYTLRGAAIGDNAFIYLATWNLSLLEGGVLEGSSEAARHICPLKGSWSSTSIRFTLQYGSSKSYIYEGDAHAVTLRGQWESSDRRHRSTTEYGTFDFVVVDVRRQLGPGDHHYYPKIFRDIVQLCLLSSIRAGDASPRIPSDLWRNVFSYCDVDWFSAPGDHLKSAPLTSTLAVGAVKLIKWAFPSVTVPRRLRRAAATRARYC